MSQKLRDTEVTRLVEHQAAAMESAYQETKVNGTVISWRFWVHQMPALTVAQFSRLCCGLDPDLFANLSAKPNGNYPADLCKKAQSIERLATLEGKYSASTNEWLSWADNHKFKVHQAFRFETNHKSQPGAFNSPAMSPVAPVPVGPTVTASDAPAQLTAAPANDAAPPAPVVAVGASGGVKLDKAGPAKPLQRTAAQDSAILCEIEKQGYNPLALPKNLPGKPGVKAATRAALSQNSLFTGGRVFDKAWERLTARADIAIQG